MLSAQGRINKLDIDARMLKALADLPVDLGIEAIDKFAMASLDSIRSKTGFMVRACMVVHCCSCFQAFLSESINDCSRSALHICRWESSSESRKTCLGAIVTPTLGTGELARSLVQPDPGLTLCDALQGCD